MSVIVRFPGTKGPIKAEKRPYGLAPKDVFIRLDLDLVTSSPAYLRLAGKALHELAAKFERASETGEMPDRVGAHRAVRACTRRIRGLSDLPAVLMEVADGRQ